MSPKSRRPYDPYTQKQSIHVPYIRYSRDAVKRQNRHFWSVCTPAILLSFGFICLAGIARDTASATLKQILCHVAMPVCGLLSAGLWVAISFVSRKAHREGWVLTYSRFEQALIANRLPLFRTQAQQDSAEAGKEAAWILPLLAAALMVAAAIWSLFQ